MYTAFVSFAQLKEYLAILTEGGLLEYNDKSQTYRTTEKGMVFLRAYNNPSEREIKLAELRSLK
jgi:predicted transcriptional regulator